MQAHVYTTVNTLQTCTSAFFYVTGLQEPLFCCWLSGCNHFYIKMSACAHARVNTWTWISMATDQKLSL